MKRYETYKETGIGQIGEIPACWEITRIGNLFDEISERYDAQCDVDAPLLSVSEYYGVAKRSEKIAEDSILVRAETLDGYKKCQKNDIVSNIMLTWKGALGCSPLDGIVSPAYCVYRPRKNIDSRYFHYLFRTKAYTDLFHVHSTGLIDSRLRLYTPKFFSLYAILPTKEEQTKIASYLDQICDKIDALILEAKASIEEYKAWKASIIYEAVTKGLDPNVEMKDSGVEWIGKIPVGWNVQKLKTLVEEPLQYGANEAGIEYDESLPRYIRITDVTANGELKEEGKLSLSKDIAADYILNDGDILLARSGGTVGKAFYYKAEYGRAAFAGYMIRAKINRKKIDPKLVYFSTLSANYEDWKATSMTQATIQNIGANKYNEFYIVVPPVEKQAELVSYLEEKVVQIDNLIVEKESLINDLESYKKSLIFEVVTGKRKVV